MIKFLLAPLFICSFLISTQVQADTVSGKTEVKKTKALKAKKAVKPKVQKQKVAIIKTKPAPQRVTVNFDNRPAPSLKKNALVLAPNSAVKKSKVRAEIRSIASADNKVSANAKKKFWSMRCKDGYISGSKVFCSIEKNATLARVNKKAKTQRALASGAITTTKKR